MTEKDFLIKVNQLNVTRDTFLIVQYLEKNEVVELTITLEFKFKSNIPAIGEGIVGCRLLVAKGTDVTMPKPGGLKISNIIDFELAN